MAILKRRTEKQKMVISMDPALQEISDKAMRRYLLTRDMSELGDLSALKDKPTVFTVLPLRVKKEYLIDNETNVMVAKELARTHIVAVSDMEMDYEDDDGIMCLSKSSIDTLPIEAVYEIAKFVIQSHSRGVDQLGFFTPQDTWLDQRKNSAMMKLLA